MEVTNLSDGEVLCYRLALLEGKIPRNIRADGVTVVVNGTVQPGVYPRTETGTFKALAFLNHGLNTVTLKLSSEPVISTSIRLFFKESERPRKLVRLVYVLGEDGDGSVDAPGDEDDDASMDSALKRVQLAGYLIQTATAEMMYRHFVGQVECPRRTFAVSHEVYLHIVDKPEAELQRMDGNELWRVLCGELQRTTDGYDREDVIDVAVMSFTRFDRKERKVRGHTALGGGPLGLFGGGSCFSWPEKIENIIECFEDSRRVDGSKVLDDSCGRSCRWGLASTTIGATLHELGHCLSLPHPTNRNMFGGGGIMHRGFDHMNRLFHVKENERWIKRDQEPFFDRGSAVRLLFHPFLNNEEKVPMSAILPRPLSTPGPTMENRMEEFQHPGTFIFSSIDGQDRILIVSSSAVRHVGFYFGGDSAGHLEFLGPPSGGGISPRTVRFSGEAHYPIEEAPAMLSISIDHIREQCKAAKDRSFTVSVIDDDGRIISADM